MGAAASAAARRNQTRKLPWWATQSRPPSEPQRVVEPVREVAKLLGRLKTVRGPCGDYKRRMTRARLYQLTCLVESILANGGKSILIPGKDLAKEWGCCLRTVRYAMAEFRARRLLMTVNTKNPQGGDGPLRIYLYKGVRRLFLAPETIAPLYPKGTDTPNLEVAGEPAAGEEQRKRPRPAGVLNNMLGALSRAETASLSDADARTLAHVQSAVPAAYAALYRDLLLKVVSPHHSAKIVAKGAFVRQRLADAMLIAGDPLPPAWVGKVRVPTEFELARMRKGAGARAAPPPGDPAAAERRLRKPGDRPPPPAERGAGGLAAAGAGLGRALGVGEKALREILERGEAELQANRAAETARKVRDITRLGGGA